VRGFDVPLPFVMMEPWSILPIPKIISLLSSIVKAAERVFRFVRVVGEIRSTAPVSALRRAELRDTEEIKRVIECQQREESLTDLLR
jgi:hypothetical protein